MRVSFAERFPWSPPEKRGRVLIVFPTGFEGTVRRICGEAAVAAGKAVEVPVPPRPNVRISGDRLSYRDRVTVEDVLTTELP